ncbi:hypothetical protein NHQ30_003224 [Ciborinia camelliae]|nr:hypothetical protein NHQ30_003224 [Ciborinia camelliae]
MANPDLSLIVIGIIATFVLCYKISYRFGAEYGASRERARIIRKLLRLGPHKLRSICLSEGVKFMARNDDGKLVRVDIGEGDGDREEDLRKHVKIVEEEIVQEIRRELREEVKNEMRREVRWEVRDELRKEIRDDMTRHGRDVKLVAEAIRDIRDIRDEVIREEMEDARKSTQDRTREIESRIGISELERKVEEKGAEKSAEQQSVNGFGSEEAMMSTTTTPSVIARTKLR